MLLLIQTTKMPKLIVNNPNATVWLTGSGFAANTVEFQEGMTILQGTVKLYLPDKGDTDFTNQMGGGWVTPPNIHTTFADAVLVNGGSLDMNMSNIDVAVLDRLQVINPNKEKR